MALLCTRIVASLLSRVLQMHVSEIELQQPMRSGVLHIFRDVHMYLSQTEKYEYPVIATVPLYRAQISWILSHFKSED
jgi:chemotaxis response regulator CheB